MQKGFSTFQKLFITILTLGSFGALIFFATAFGGMKFGMTLNLASTAGGLDNGLLGHWTFDGKDMPNGQVNDTSGNGIHGSMQNMSTSTAYVQGAIGQALRFDGTDDRVATTNGVSIKGLTRASVSLWFKLDVITGGTEVLYEEANGLLAGSSRFSLRIQGSILRFAGRAQDADAFTVWVDSATTLVPNTWYHAVGVFDSVSDVHAIYLNGVKESASVSTPGFDNTTPVVVPKIGMRGSQVDFLQGSLDDVRVYNRALSDDEAKQLYQLGATTHISSTPSPSPRVGGLDYGLVGHWTFDGKDTQTGEVLDTSGSGNNGSQMNMSTSTAYVQGAIGQALNFDGSNDFIELGTPSSLDLSGTNTLTLSAWINLRTVSGSGLKRIISFPLDTGVGAEEYALLFSDTANEIQMWIGLGGSGTQDNVTASLSSTGWHHVAGVLNGRAMAIYIDGVLAGSDTHIGSGNLSTHLNGSFQIGRYDSGFGQYFDGSIDDARFYNRALTPDEIKQLYQLGATTHISSTPSPSPRVGGLDYGLVGHWTFDGKDTQTGEVLDTSGNGNNGSEVNMSTSTAYVQGVVGQALRFDGNDDKIDAGSASNLDDLSAMSVSFWMNAKSLGGSSNGNVVSKQSANSANPNDGWTVVLTTTNTISFRADYGTVGNATDDLRTYAANSTVTFNNWDHYVFTWTGANASSAVRIFKNGVEVSYGTTQEPTGSRNTDAAQTLKIANTIGNTRGFDGSLDDVRVYNRVLTLDEIKQLYQMGQ